MVKNPQNNEDKGKDDARDDSIPVCGIIMPIAKTEGYPEKHWADVYSILCEVATQAEFNPNLVSFDDDVGIIHKRIVQNIYSNPIVICDISSRNANVMLELGMRLAFDKPTIIIKDDKTPYSFDIAAIEHLEYPSDLRYQLINDFKQRLHSKIVETYKRSKIDGDYTTFLKHFGTFKVAKIDEKEVSGVEYLAAEVKELKSLLVGTLSSIGNKSSNYINGKFIPSVGTTARLDVRVPETLVGKVTRRSIFHLLLDYGLEGLSISSDQEEAEMIVSYERTPNAPTPKMVYAIIEKYFLDLLDGN
ncbi:hypothetical protein L9Y59_003511 [Klebsiella variicola]|uniref:hypothetical protein n=1 Tax=Klebsiella variicola TaxID=244366 RepID=UPI00069A11C1|nr:hypothetical protein [Klebsiella variicola]EKU8622600.1 hypothetical protein [Klebsiella variicola]HDK6502645.1 hypothetical protein [Klebsiella pneumoniae]